MADGSRDEIPGIRVNTPNMDPDYPKLKGAVRAAIAISPATVITASASTDIPDYLDF
jgi:hypothetical protein